MPSLPSGLRNELRGVLLRCAPVERDADTSV
jgi:hypothetical protein